MITTQSGYMSSAFGDPNILADAARATLADVDFDTIVGRGMSGALVIPSLARALDKHWLIVRKPGENSHSYQPTEGTLGERWIFVDDFVGSGATRDACQAAVAKLVVEQPSYKGASATYIGTYMYEHDEFEAATAEAPVTSPEPEAECDCSLCSGAWRTAPTF